ncbi:DUF6531 domain-containing protein, partial [Methylovulum miyakonense]
MFPSISAIFIFAGNPQLPPNSPTDYYCPLQPTTAPQPTKTPPPELCSGSPFKGNPINTSLGDKVQIEKDYEDSNSLRFERTYHSHAGVANTSNNLGAQWRHYYDRSITSSTWEITPPVDGQTAMVAKYDGRRLVFKYSQATDKWTPDPDITDRLEYLKDSNNVFSGWKLTDRNDNAETYRTDGKLQALKNRSGSVNLVLDYSTKDTPLSSLYTAAAQAPAPLVAVSGKLLSVTDQITHHTLTFLYDEKLRMAQMTVPGGSVYQYQYDLDKDGNTLEAYGNLTTVVYPESTPTNPVIRTYEYNNPSYVPAAFSNPVVGIHNALTGIIDENGQRYATWSYDTQGLAVSSQHGDVSKNIDRVDIAYTSGTSSTISEGLRDTSGNLLNPGQPMNFQIIQGVAKVTSQSQPAATPNPSSCPTSASNLRYDTNGNIIQRTDFNGNVTCYAYDTARNLETVRIEGIAKGSPLLAGGQCPTDVQGSAPTANTAERKITTQWHPRFRVPEKKAEPERLTTWAWGDSTNANAPQCGKNGAVADGVLCSKTVQSTNDGTGALGLAASPASTRKWLYTYNAFGQTLSVDGPRNNVSDASDKSQYGYYTDTETNVNNRRMLKTTTNALGQVTTYDSYDAHGRPTQITAANGVVTQLAYTPRGQLQTVTTAGRSTQLAYYPNTLLNTVTSPATGTTTYTYDDAHRLNTIQNAAGEKLKYVLDNLGNRTKERTVTGSGASEITYTSVNRRFDNLGRLWKLLNAANQLVSEYNYDPNGNLTATTDYPDGTAANKQQTLNGYDALDRMDLLTNVIDSVTSYLTTYGYDGLGQLTQVKDPRANSTASPRPNGTGFTTNGLGNQSQENSQDRGVTNNTGFDPAGNLKTRIDARNTTTQYTYDALDRLLTDSTYLADANGAAQATTVDSTISYRYDLNTADLTANPPAKNAVGQLSHVDDPSGSTDWQYDGEGRLQTKTHSISTAQASRNLSVSYTYDAISGRVATMTYPSGFTVGYSYDPAGRPSQLAYAQSPTGTFTTLLDAFAYQPWGGVKSYTLSTVTGTPAVSRHYDSDGRIDGYTLNTGTKKLAYDRIGNVTQLGDGGFTDTTVSNANNYVYDGLGRLTDFTPFT